MPIHRRAFSWVEQNPVPFYFKVHFHCSWSFGSIKNHLSIVFRPCYTAISLSQVLNFPCDVFCWVCPTFIPFPNLRNPFWGLLEPIPASVRWRWIIPWMGHQSSAHSYLETPYDLWGMFCDLGRKPEKGQARPFSLWHENANHYTTVHPSVCHVYVYSLKFLPLSFAFPTSTTIGPNNCHKDLAAMC